jgi:hypothetical protein
MPTTRVYHSEIQALDEKIYRQCSAIADASVYLEAKRYFGNVKFPNLSDWESHERKLILELHKLRSKRSAFHSER